ncbi:MAG: hypothetical protein J5781_03835 [Clostridia bacterium]|nr:hypothetical protein [Clostridia bacterium]
MKIRLLLLSVLLLFLLGSCEKTTPDPEPASCDHEWPESYALIEPTVEEDGARVYTCVLCGQTKTEVIPALSEEDYFVIRESATCEEEGKETYSSDEWGEYEVVLQATGHKYGREPDYTTAECTTDGEDVYACKNCGEEKKVPRFALGHDYKLLAVHEGTCIDKGYTEYQCLRCGDIFNANYTDYVHDYEVGEYVEGNCAEKGYTPYVCRLCQKEKREYTDYAHIYNKDTGRCALCDAPCAHVFEDYVCSVCRFDIREELNDRSGIFVCGDIMYFGTYPQSHVSDVEIIAVLDEYFLDNASKTEYTYMGITYVKADAAAQASSPMSFSDGTPLSKTLNGGKTVHYFRCDPIAWVQGKNGVLVADRILDTSAYQENYTVSGSVSYYEEQSGIYANNWSVSTVRRFLTETFYQRAFNEKQKALIATTENDNENSGYYKPANSRPWCTQDATTDLIYLPSYADLYEKDAEVDAPNASLTKKVSDYALCTLGADNKLNATSRWYLRSPGLYSGQICTIGSSGELAFDTPLYDEKTINGETKKVGMGIVPALKLHLSE